MALQNMPERSLPPARRDNVWAHVLFQVCTCSGIPVLKVSRLIIIAAVAL